MQGRIVSTAEVRRARRVDREGAPASAGSAPPANELTSITPQLVAIGLHFPYRASHTQGQRLDLQQWGLDSCPLSQQGNNVRLETAETITRHTYLRQRFFLNDLELSEDFQPLASDRCAEGCGGSWSQVFIIRCEL